MIAGARSGTSGATSKRVSSRRRQAPRRNGAQAGQLAAWASASPTTARRSSMASLTESWAASHLTGGLPFGERSDQRGPGSVHPALHRPELDPEDRGGLLVVESQDLDRHERLAELQREPPDGVGDPQALLHAARGLGERALGRKGHQHVVLHRSLSPGPAVGIDRAVAGDAKQPARERRLPPERPDRADGLEEGEVLE